MTYNYISPEFSKIITKILAAENPSSEQEEDLKNYIKLVIKLAKIYVRTKAELEDLIMVGCIGLLRARRDFDDKRSDNFRAYASMCIVGEIYRYCVSNMTSITIPAYIAKASTYIWKIERALTSSKCFFSRNEIDTIVLNYDDPLEQDIEESILENVKYSKDRIANIAKNSSIDYETLAALAKGSIVSTISDSILLSNTVPSDCVEKKAGESELQEKLLNSLGAKRYAVLKLHYDGFTNPEIANILYEYGYTGASDKPMSRAAVKSILDSTIRTVQKMGFFNRLGK